MITGDAKVRKSLEINIIFVLRNWTLNIMNLVPIG
ncbi:hypothetical protein TcasGA2_TC034319 [Tribolium castaneum]|uniref:Uncharacterized protein n=1 Tax=Tribolium castaneum TaxID=7070 RepID=A0A139WCJ1_TRICA|nr:hypothetical protein TcasGA2_TC034319 [Tribolium castaneum]